MKVGLVDGGYFYLLLPFQETFNFKFSEVSDCYRNSFVSSPH